MRNRSIDALPVVLSDQSTFSMERIESGYKPVKLLVYDVTYLHFHKHIELGYCVSGEGICYVDDVAYPFSAGDVQIIFPYQKHLSKNTTEVPSTWFWASIDPVEIMEEAGFTEHERISSWIANEMGICGIVDPKQYPDICDGIRKLIDHIFIENPKTSHRKEAFAADFLSLLICICHRSAGLNQLSIRQDEKLKQLAPALDLVKETLQSETIPTVAQMSNACHMSVANFRKVFLKALGVSPKEYITACVIHKAKRELILSKKSVTEIAGVVGYQNISGFNRCFLESTGMTPTQFRASLQGYHVSAHTP